ncbi:MarR family winged helix-turn-helix transcriptional regulator [Fervidibacillus albus]|uniref:MarR family transcriptional regulator n=1 Tax=Fervidibacillus albus TaxID=2980026 RepID=A0A9E8LV03_9BACI|nr:MarR family transcriptional regulator [Fervidibacillus albus]WAA10195.1 MarR family transcriptional regulator [Fervidibacillus albus]
MDTNIDRIHKAMHRIRKYMDMELQSSTITNHQFFLLSTIFREGGCKLSYLAEKLQVTPSAITVMIDRLEKSQYIVRTPDPQDRRATIVKLTADGEKMLKQSLRERNEIMGRKIAVLNEDEIRLLADLVEKIADTKTDEQT